MSKVGLSLMLVFCSLLAFGQTKRIDGVYGEDNRYESFERPQTYALAQSVAAQIHSGFFHFNSQGKIEITEIVTLKEEFKLCEGVRFGNQPILASCSGALVSEDLILTAGHCVQQRTDCRDFFWVFGYEMSKNGAAKEIGAENIYSCTKIERKVYNGYADYALIRLDRPVRARTPLKVAAANYRSKKGDDIFMIGYPSGLPLKTTEAAKVTGFEGNSFLSNLDAFAANSGSPVFNSQTKEIVGVLIAGDEDYTMTRNQCSVISKYPESGSGEEVLSVHVVPRIF